VHGREAGVDAQAAAYQLASALDVGVSQFQIDFDDMTTFRRFIDEVVPAVRLERRR